MKERVYRFRARERSIVSSRAAARVLDVGCGRGDNLRRLVRYGADACGIEPDLSRARDAARTAPVVAARAEALPWPDGHFDLVYICHVLHHVADLDAVLGECVRVLAPGGLLFVVETVEDSPLLRAARRLRPVWEGDPVTQRFRRAGLAAALADRGLELVELTAFNWIYFAWELLPLRWSSLEIFTPVFVGLERALGWAFDRFGAHCWAVARKPGRARFAEPPVTRRAGQGAAIAL